MDWWRIKWNYHCLFGIANLIKQKIITVPFSDFYIVDGGEILSRYFVEAFGVKHNIKGTIISLIALESKGYNESAILLEDYNSFACSCFVTKSSFNSSFQMDILITYTTNY